MDFENEVKQILGSGRDFTKGERRYVEQWKIMNIALDVIAVGYQLTCRNVGHLSFPYLNALLMGWYNKGIRTVDEVKAALTQKPQAGDVPRLSCPRCKTGVLVVRESKNNSRFFVGCSNFPRCDYAGKEVPTPIEGKVCPDCGGFLVKRHGPYGDFLGCLNFPRCHYKCNDV